MLVDDAGDANGPYAGTLTLGSTGTIHNSRCTVGLVSATGSGTNFTLTLSVTFAAGFCGNQIAWVAAGDPLTGNSGWQALGVWQVPFTAPGTVAVASVSPGHVGQAAGTSQQLQVTVTDAKGAGDLGIVNVLINQFIDGRRLPGLRVIVQYPVSDDAGDAGGPYAGGLTVNSRGGAIQNSQCSVSGAGSSVSLSGNSLTLTLNLPFAAGYRGNRVVYMAGRDVAGGNNTDWQAMGTWSVQ